MHAGSTFTSVIAIVVLATSSQILVAQASDSLRVVGPFVDTFYVESSCASVAPWSLRDYVGSLIRYIEVVDTFMYPSDQRWNADGTPRHRHLDSVEAYVLAWKTEDVEVGSRTAKRNDSSHLWNVGASVRVLCVAVIAYFDVDSNRKEWCLVNAQVFDNRDVIEEDHDNPVVPAIKAPYFFGGISDIVVRASRPTYEDLLAWIGAPQFEASEVPGRMDGGARDGFFSLESYRSVSTSAVFGDSYLLRTYRDGNICSGSWLTLTGSRPPVVPGWIVQ